MIIRAGENVYCVEIEHVLAEHPDVLDVAVVGVPHRELGEEVKAVVQLRAGSTTTVEDLRAYCGERLASFKVPEYVDVRGRAAAAEPRGQGPEERPAGGERRVRVLDRGEQRLRALTMDPR